MFGYSITTVSAASAASALILRNLYYTLTFNQQIARAKSALETTQLAEIKETPIARKDMHPGTLQELNDQHELSFAIKPGFEDEFRRFFGCETPLYHTSCAYSISVRDGAEDRIKWLVYGRQSPKFKTQNSEGHAPLDDSKHSSLRTMGDNEIHYTLMESDPTDQTRTTFHLLRTGIYFTGAEIKHVTEKANATICGDTHPLRGLNTFITSNCYTFSVYCLTQYIDLLINKHKNPTCQRENILKLYNLLIKTCSHSTSYSQGICNNAPVREAVYKSIQLVEKALLPAPDLRQQAQDLRQQPDDLRWGNLYSEKRYFARDR